VKVVLSASARDDVKQIRLRYAKSPYARKWFARVLSGAIRHLERFPGTAQRRPDVSGYDVFFWRAESFWLVLQQEPDITIIVAVVHTSRELNQALRDLAL
jgi:plasmid stabilization system protein ParE